MWQYISQTRLIRFLVAATRPAPTTLLWVSLLGLIVLPLGDEASAQGSPRAWGLAGAFTAAARGLDAVSWNPANLAIDDGVTVGIATAAADLSNNSFTLARYNEVSGATLTQQDKEQILADIPPEGFSLNAEVQASALGYRSGRFALSFQGLGGGSGNLDKDFFDLVLMGNPVGQSVSFADTYGEAYAVGAATLSLAQPVLTGFKSRLSIGVNVRYLYGIYELHVEEAEGSMRTTMTEVEGSATASLATASGGGGYGADLGLALQAPAGWTFGLMLNNVVSHLNWSHDPERHLFSVSADSISLMQEEVGDAVTDQDTTYAIDPYQTRLPRSVRLGASNSFGPWLVGMDVAQGLENRAGQSTRTEVSAGLELRALPWIHPRFGLSFGGAAGQSAAVGLGLRLGPWTVDLAAVNRGQLIPGDTKGLALAAGTALEF